MRGHGLCSIALPLLHTPLLYLDWTAETNKILLLLFPISYVFGLIQDGGFWPRNVVYLFSL